VFRRLVPLLIALVPFAAEAATLTVKVENIGAKGGILRLSLYDETSWSKEPDSPLASANVPAVAPETTVTLTDIKPGVYGVKAFQDANRNDKFDQGFLGIPLERFGFSRDARPFLSAPGFGRTEFTIVDGENEIVIHLQ
jgi:uncharacterized protein (DUF2141 family)